MIPIFVNRYQRITTTTTWTPPTGVEAVWGHVQGAGGGGGSGQESNGVGDDPGGGGAGGGSGVAVESWVGVSGGTPATIGAGGSGGVAGAGSAGGSTTFDSLTAAGGNAGAAGTLVSDAPGGALIPVATPGGTGTASASLPVQAYSFHGNRGFGGGQGARIGTSVNLAGMNAALLPGGPRGEIGAAPAIGTGAGGGASTDYGIGGTGGNGGNNSVFPGFPGTDGNGYGSGGGGGGGAATFSVGGPQQGGDGGDGAPGVIELWWVNVSVDEPPPCWKLHRIEWLQDPEPFDITHYESQESTHGYHGFHFERDAWLELRCTTTVALTVIVDGVTQNPVYSIPTTGDVRTKVYIPLRANKGKLYRYFLDSATAFHVYRFQVRAKGWGDGPYDMKQPLTGTEAPWDVDAIRGPDPRII